MNSKLHEAFYPDHNNILFPHEEIAAVANLIKTSNSISWQAIQTYCCDHLSDSYVVNVIERNEMIIADKITHTLTRQQRRKLEREYKERPYGDVRLHSRLSYTPRT